ncbi:MAG: hypothetical protein ACE5H4_15690 [Candidatus Thorarchaeota archaeon]
MIAKAVDILLGILRNEKTTGLPLTTTKKMLEERIGTQMEGDASSLAQQAIDYALDHWLVDKIIDYPGDEDTLPTWKRAWFLRVLSEEESRRLKQLPEVKRAFLRLLHECETEKELGAIREQDALRSLRELGFNIDKVPWISHKISTTYEKEADKPIIWYYLTPQDELSEEFKATMEEADRKDWERQLRFMRADDRDDREAARKRRKSGINKSSE